MKRLVVIFFICFSFSCLYSQNAVSLKNEGNKALGAQQYGIALLKFEGALKVWGNKPPDNAMIFSMGTCAYRLNDMKKSLKYIDMTIAAGYNLDMAYQYRACIMKAQNNTEGYFSTLREGLAKVPASKSLKESLAKYYYSEGSSHYHKGSDILKSTNEKLHAGKYMSTDKALKEDNARARDEFNQAIKLMQLSLELVPNDENARTIIGNCQVKLKAMI